MPSSPGLLTVALQRLCETGTHTAVILVSFSPLLSSVLRVLLSALDSPHRKGNPIFTYRREEIPWQSSGCPPLLPSPPLSSPLLSSSLLSSCLLSSPLLSSCLLFSPLLSSPLLLSPFPHSLIEPPTQELSALMLGSQTYFALA